MEIASMAAGIIDIINTEYADYADCIDITKIKELCNMCESDDDIQTLSLNDIELSSPAFKKDVQKSRKQSSRKGASSKSARKSKRTPVPESKEFFKKYGFFIKMVYSCLKLEVEIFELHSEDNIMIMKNNYHLIKTLEKTKCKFLIQHMAILKTQYKRISEPIDDEYQSYVRGYLVKMRILDRVIRNMRRLVESETLDKRDNLLTLLLPYFYKKMDFIEEYS